MHSFSGGLSKMKTLTIRGIEPELADTLKNMAKRQGKSVNQIVINALKKYSGIEKERRFTRVHHDLKDIFGKWTPEEFNEIQSKIDTGRKIDPELWK
jgi:hypothetical protein